jgi:hypothetical protein
MPASLVQTGRKERTIMHIDEQKNSFDTFKSCGPMMMHTPRSCGMGFGVMLILVGTIWLASKTGLLNPDLLWPVVILAMGVAVLALKLTRGRRLPTNHKQNKEG